jgi:hypothetical protein
MTFSTIEGPHPGPGFGEGGKNSSLSADEVCRIIEACSKANVRILKFAGLKVELAATPAPEITPVPMSELVLEQSSSEAEISEIQRNIISKEVLESAEEELRERQIEDLLITDPLEAERMIQNRELEDEDEPGSE